MVIHQEQYRVVVFDLQDRVFVPRDQGAMNSILRNDGIGCFRAVFKPEEEKREINLILEYFDQDAVHMPEFGVMVHRYISEGHLISLYEGTNTCDVEMSYEKINF